MTKNPKKTTYEVLLDIQFYSENNEDDYLHNVKRVTPNSYLKIVKKLFDANLNKPNIVKLALPETNTLVSWKLTYENKPTVFKLTYTTSKALNAEDKKFGPRPLIEISLKAEAVIISLSSFGFINKCNTWRFFGVLGTNHSIILITRK